MLEKYPDRTENVLKEVASGRTGISGGGIPLKFGNSNQYSMDIW